MSRSVSTDDRLLRELEQQGDLRDTLMLRVGLGVSLTAALFSLIGIFVHDQPQANIVGAMLGGVASLWFVVRLVTTHIPIFARIGKTFGWLFVAALPCLYILAYGHFVDATRGITAWAPAQLIALIIAFSTLRLITWFPALVAASSATAYLSVFAWLRMHVDLETAASDAFRWEVALFRAGCLIGWGALAGLLVRAIRKVVARAGRAARANDLLSKYQLGETIGVGGMGEVRKATYCPEGGFVSEVAIKRIHPELARRPGIVERFRDEAALGARLRHHNIVATLDFGRMDATYFLAMEHIDGASLRHLWRKNRQRGSRTPESIVASVGLQILDGLRFAHEVAVCPEGHTLRVLHRDLCPNNVLVTRAGHVKIADFGVAHALRDDARYQPREVIGKVGYLSPEAAKLGLIDERSDLFAVGCVLWELLTGERAFKRKSPEQSLRAVVECDLGAAPGRRELPMRWLAFFERAMARDPNERFRTAGDMSRALGQLVFAPATQGEVAGWVASLTEGEIFPMDEVSVSEPTAPFLDEDEVPSLLAA